MNVLEVQIPHFVKTDLHFGMQAEHYYKAREIFD